MRKITKIMLFNTAKITIITMLVLFLLNLIFKSVTSIP